MRAYRNFVMFKSDISYLIFSKKHNYIAGIVRKVGLRLTTQYEDSD